MCISLRRAASCILRVHAWLLTYTRLKQAFAAPSIPNLSVMADEKMVYWYTCKCPCPDQTQHACGVAEGADRCKLGGANLKSCNTAEEARQTVINHLTASPYHNMPADNAQQWADGCDVEETSMTEGDHAAYCEKFRESNDNKKRGRLENAEQHIKNANGILLKMGQMLEANNQRQSGPAVAIGARPTGGARSSGSGGAQSTGSWVVPRRHVSAPLPGEFVTLPATEMQSVLDCMGRAIRASRGAEKLASTAAFAFRAEAEALEQSMEHIETMLERSASHY
jgi:hypothetical protein